MHMRSDEEQLDMEARARAVYPNSFAVREGQQFELPAHLRKK